ncbi:MAG: choice-of-anchor B family protein [Ignavibacteria bacterium]|nr:choice-of-anchor B family protein [Ignavibacteria bacterium]
MKTALAFALLLAGTTSSIQAQESYNVVQIGRIWFDGLSFGADTAGGSDCWGYTAPDGTEYAIVGTVTGIAFVNAATMEVVDEIQGPTNGDFPWKHRDIKTYRHYAYAVGEMTGTNAGLMIMDLSTLPDSVRFVQAYHPAGDVTSHNFSIDTTMGYAYILKQGYTGFRMVSLADPENPVEMGTVTTPNIHDVYARNDTVWVAEGWSPTFSMYDVSNKAAPSLILRHPIPAGGYSHNIWPTDDGRYAITTEETDFKTVKIWDVSDPGNVTLVGEYLGSSNLAHNVHVKGDLVYISHYEAGVTVVDISDPANPVEVAAFDTFPRGDNPNFRGCWGAYPFTQNGYFYASDIEGYLTVLQLDSVSTGVGTSPELPAGFSLEQNYPNPFNPATSITFHLAEAGFVALTVYDILGREIATLVSENLSAGTYRREWNAKGEASGVYLYRLQAGNMVESRRMVLAR